MEDQKNVVLIYDASFSGFLTCVFEVYDRKLQQPRIVRHKISSFYMFEQTMHVITDDERAQRVLTGITKVSSTKTVRKLFLAFLSEQDNIEQTLLEFIQYLFRTKKDISTDYSHAAVIAVSEAVKKVRREAHRMEAFIRFKLTKDNLYYANVTPDFNVLPVILHHFEERYADQKWFIYDIARGYGLFYDLKTTEYVYPSGAIPDSSGAIWDEVEDDYQKLWKDYFDSTNISERKNTKLHLRHVPKRYWKYLSEKGGRN